MSDADTVRELRAALVAHHASAAAVAVLDREIARIAARAHAPVTSSSATVPKVISMWDRNR